MDNRITPDDIDGIKEWANCRVADVDAAGDVWIADPQSGHWLSDEAKAAYIIWRNPTRTHNN